MSAAIDANNVLITKWGTTDNPQQSRRRLLAVFSGEGSRQLLQTTYSVNVASSARLASPAAAAAAATRLSQAASDGSLRVGTRH